MRLLALSLSLALIALPAGAATPIKQSRPLAADGTVSIENLKGRIVVRSWDRPEVSVTGSLGAGVDKLLIDGSRQSLSIQVRYPKKGGGWFGDWGGSSGKSEPTLLEVTVPVGASLNLDSVSADVDVSGSRGRRLSIETVSGNVLVAGSAVADTRVESVSGELDLTVDSNAVNASSVSGDIRLQGKIGGRVRLETVSGDAKLSAGAVERLDFSAVSGNGQINTALTADAVVHAESLSGDLDVSLPGTSSARIQIESFSGSIHSPIGKVIREEVGPGRSLDARMGTGSAEVKLESFSGSVTLSTR